MREYMFTRLSGTALLLLAASPLLAQNSWFQPSLLEKPEVRKALQSVDERASAIVDEWIRLVEIPAPSGKEQARAEYIRAEMQKLGLTDIRTDDISNVSGVRKGTGGGPTVVFARPHGHRIPEGTDVKVKREGDILRAPGIGDDTSNLMATLEMFRALEPRRRADQRRSRLPRLRAGGIRPARREALAGEAAATSRTCSSPWTSRPTQVWYGALRITQFKFFYTSPGAHTMESRGGPSPAKAVAKAIDARLRDPAAAGRRGTRHVQAAGAERRHVRRRHGGQRRFRARRGSRWTCARSTRRRRTGWRARWFARPRTEPRRTGGRRLPHGEEDGASTTRRRGRSEERLNHPLVQTALATEQPLPRSRARRRSSRPTSGSTDANIAVSMGIPAVAIGAVAETHAAPSRGDHADASSIVPGIKSLIALAVALTTH